MHRSGTSLVAGLVDAWGLYGGPPQALLPPDEYNPHGYFEHLPLVRMNARLLDRLDSRWYVPPADPSSVMHLISEAALVAEAHTVVNAMRKDGRPRYWKDPRLCITLPFWDAIWKRPALILVVRNPLDVARSLHHRDGFPISAGLLLWQYYTRLIQAHVRLRSDALLLSYEWIMSDPDAACECLAEFLLQIAEPVGHRASKRMKRHIAPSASRFTSAPSIKHPMLTDDQERLHDLLLQQARTQRERAISTGPKQRRRQGGDFALDDDFPLYAGWRDYLLTFAALIRCRQALGERFG